MLISGEAYDQHSFRGIAVIWLDPVDRWRRFLSILIFPSYYTSAFTFPTVCNLQIALAPLILLICSDAT